MSECLEVWPLKRVLAEVRCGSQDWTWEEEWADLDQRHASTGYLAGLEQRIRENGITMPVLIGSDGRLWDGHHRLRLAVRLGIEYVPVEITRPADLAAVRCSSCEHEPKYHDVDGRCWFTVGQGLPERDAVCSCQLRCMTDTPDEQDEDA